MSWSLPEVPDGDPLRPYDLRCEHRATPLGIGTPVPRLSWRLASDRRGDAQHAYRVRVHARGALVWDSGWVEGQDVSADYGGAPLASFTRYTWRVEVRGGGSAQMRHGGAAESWFDTGVMHQDEWRAAWIGHDPETEPPFEPPTDDRESRSPRTAHLPAPRYFRRVVDLPPATAHPAVARRAAEVGLGLVRHAAGPAEQPVGGGRRRAAAGRPHPAGRGGHRARADDRPVLGPGVRHAPPRDDARTRAHPTCERAAAGHRRLATRAGGERHRLDARAGGHR
ncbi:hypothetical protein [Nonomuraea sp. B19D2]|uniref:glycoside hydrolase family 78 protein n=1 Tax=Nonomuraea sp. B19D2 TaxID=3159561 RepID=UPI0032DB61C2